MSPPNRNVLLTEAIWGVGHRTIDNDPERVRPVATEAERRWGQGGDSVRGRLQWLRPRAGQPAHELRVRSHIEGSMLHVEIDGVGPGIRHLNASFEVGSQAVVAARVIDGLALRQKIDGFVDPFRRLRLT